MPLHSTPRFPTLFLLDKKVYLGRVKAEDGPGVAARLGDGPLHPGWRLDELGASARVRGGAR